MKNLTILITAAGAQFAPGIIACLKNNGERAIRIIGTDTSIDYTINQMVDRFYVVPRASDIQYVDALLDICNEARVDILIPFMSAELQAIKDRRKEFDLIGTKVSISDNEALSIANNKLKLYDFMKKHGFQTPAFYKVDKISNLKNICEKLGYPNKAVCVKATESSGSRGIRIIDSKKSRLDLLFREKPNSFYTSLDELIQTLNAGQNIPELMAMEYLPGKEYSVDLLADNGKVLYIAGRESNSILASIPQEATLKADDMAYSLSIDIINKLGLDGNADLDFKYNSHNEPVLMEINPRIAATMSIFFAGGLNLPYLRVKQLMGETLPAVQVQYGVKMKRRYLEMFVDQQGSKINI